MVRRHNYDNDNIFDLVIVDDVFIIVPDIAVVFIVIVVIIS